MIKPSATGGFYDWNIVHESLPYHRNNRGRVMRTTRSCFWSGDTAVRFRTLLVGALCFLAIAAASLEPARAAKYAAIVIEETSGKVLFARNADKSRYPASLTKIMTLYLLFEELESGRMTMRTKMPVSRVAASRSPSKLYLKPGQTITVKDAIYALITKSANDVATVVGEALSGTEREFGKRMTRKARALGMSATTFRNASGLPHS